MKQLFALIFLFLSFPDFAQLNSGKVYLWNEVKHANPDTIQAVSFEKLKLDSLPSLSNIEKCIRLGTILEFTP